MGIVSLSLLITTALIKTHKPPEKEETPKPQVTVEVTKVHQQDLHFILQSQGVVVPRTESRLTSEVNGHIVTTSPFFRVGAFTQKGDILVQIDDSNYKTALKSAEAELARTKANLQEEAARVKTLMYNLLKLRLLRYNETWNVLLSVHPILA